MKNRFPLTSGQIPQTSCSSDWINWNPHKMYRKWIGSVIGRPVNEIKRAVYIPITHEKIHKALVHGSHKARTVYLPLTHRYSQKVLPMGKIRHLILYSSTSHHQSKFLVVFLKTSVSLRSVPFVIYCLWHAKGLRVSVRCTLVVSCYCTKPTPARSYGGLYFIHPWA